MPKKISVTDHLGNQFESISQMCEHWGVVPNTFKKRITKMGWSIEKALTEPTTKDKYIDHLGNEFPSIYKMAEFHGYDSLLVSNRLKRGWPIKDALTKEVRVRFVNNPDAVDDKGNKFNSVSEMCRHYRILRIKYEGRSRKGRSKSELLDNKRPGYINIVKDHLGNEHLNIIEMCKHYNISRQCYYYRINNGWSLKEALEGKKKDIIKDHRGRIFSTLKEMADNYNICDKVLNGRLKIGWDLEKALTTPVRKYKVGEEDKNMTINHNK